ncbi:uncharacterized protein LOC106867766 [Octopus bimaculoides]|nr:uncharacterized protein LOC106867766 [Octopus bimaculoides]|eukprot:XP_014768231.1 PREDICTED: uncharacterized protein LOC106867766 [Octopus bimaculoides]
MGELIQKCHLIVWDECTMSHKKAFEAVDRTLQDIRNCNSMMENVTVLLPADFRQTLPVVPRGTKVDEHNALIRSSAPCENTSTFELFAEQLLKLAAIDEEQFLTFNPICNSADSTNDLVAEILLNLLHNYNNTNWISEQAILVPKNVAVNNINNMLLNKLAGEVCTYNSIDSAVDDQDSVNYSIEFLNSLESSGSTPYCFQL